MDHKQRHKRLRLLVSRVNKERKKQAQKIDIVCNDLIAAQREFIKRLNTISFAANFYESILGTTDLNGLFCTAGKLIKGEMPDASVAFFLRQQDNFKLHMFESDQPIDLEKQRFENCFTPELVDNICKSNKVCTLEEMLAIGLQGNPASLNKISAVTIPLGRPGSSVGFILIYRPLENELTAAEVNHIAVIASGLSRAVISCRAPLYAED